MLSLFNKYFCPLVFNPSLYMLKILFFHHVLENIVIKYISIIAFRYLLTLIAFIIIFTSQQ